MLIGIDASFLDDKYLGGKEQVLLNLVQGFVDNGYSNQLIIFGSEKSRFKFEAISEDISFRSYPFLDIPHIKSLIKLVCFRTFILPKEAMKESVSVLLMNISYTGFSKFSMPTIVLPHDIQFKYNPKYNSILIRMIDTACYYWDFRLRDYIIAISDFDESEIIKHYPSFSNKIKKIYNPIIYRKNEDCSIDKSLKQPYIFANNLSSPHKNSKTLLKAFESIIDKTHCNLIISGSFYKNDQETVELIERLESSKRLILTGYLSKQAFNSILSNAKLFVNPSNFEGFGMSAVEAMLAEIPCLLSDNTATYTVTLGRASYYSPANDSEKLATSILDCLSSRPEPLYLKTSRKLMEEKYGYMEIASQYLELIFSAKKI